MSFKFPDSGLEFSLGHHTILLGYGGSKSYGTDTPDSDTDYRGVLIPPGIYYTSPFKGFEQHSWKEGDAEGTIWGIRKFFTLAANCNPNVLELLFVDSSHLFVVSEAGQLLIDNRDLFLSQKAVYSFCGYATSQLMRIKTHKSWLDHPPAKRPTRTGFGLPELRPIPGDQLKAAEALVERAIHVAAPWLLRGNNAEREEFWKAVQETAAICTSPDSWLDIRDSAANTVAAKLGFDANFIEYLKKEKAFEAASHNYEMYQRWLQERNPARAELESKYGFDCKHAVHLVRLLRMGRELITSGKLTVLRPDAKELLTIRNGAWSFEVLLAWAETETQALYDLVRAGKTTLPSHPNISGLEKLYTEVMEYGPSN